ncbi:hypothetical protein C0Q70_09617 [Pomacea canaliculata]|uniref:Uncharacterized protein n=1 Tax=Pomacea canaliculata TaxID=400727 RepID=A0A2T7PAB1_POMCA|nr:hypothetical protein C0Q70_09617 [Pomacea canaliculata]
MTLWESLGSTQMGGYALVHEIGLRERDGKLAEDEGCCHRAAVIIDVKTGRVELRATQEYSIHSQFNGGGTRDGLMLPSLTRCSPLARCSATDMFVATGTHIRPLKCTDPSNS